MRTPCVLVGIAATAAISATAHAGFTPTTTTIIASGEAFLVSGNGPQRGLAEGIAFSLTFEYDVNAAPLNRGGVDLDSYEVANLIDLTFNDAQLIAVTGNQRVVDGLNIGFDGYSAAWFGSGLDVGPFISGRGISAIDSDWELDFSLTGPGTTLSSTDLPTFETLQQLDIAAGTLTTGGEGDRGLPEIVFNLEVNSLEFVVPAPGSAALLGLTGLMAVRRRRG